MPRVSHDGSLWAESVKPNEKSNRKTGFCNLEQVTLKPKLQFQHCMAAWLQIRYHSLVWGDTENTVNDRERYRFKKQNCYFDVHAAQLVEMYGFKTTLGPNTLIPFLP